MWEIRRYDVSRKGEWDKFIDQARNATFLFKRGYMDYHADRFSDFSLMAYRRDKLVAVLPANIADGTLCSHQGLTYGGWVLAPRGLDATDIFHMWKMWLEFCKDNGICSIIYKPLPYIYAMRPSQEDLYMLFLSKATLLSTDISTAIDLESNPGFNSLQKRHLKRTSDQFYCAQAHSTQIRKIEAFHELLTKCLAERHEASPVHSVEELKLLMSRFPEEIVIWGAYSEENDSLCAAVCVYETPQCAHCQYIATSDEGREKNALAFLVDEMVKTFTAQDYRYLDFGISNEKGGLHLNPGLNRQKTSYGGSGVAYSRYEINVVSALESLPNELWPPK